MVYRRDKIPGRYKMSDLPTYYTLRRCKRNSVVGVTIICRIKQTLYMKNGHSLKMVHVSYGVARLVSTTAHVVLGCVFTLLSSYKRYFYTNNGTGESQWEYPQIKRKVPSQRTTIQAITTTTTIATTAATAADTQDPYRVSDDRGDSTPPLSHVDSIPAPPDNHVIPAPPLPNDDNIMVIPPPPPPPTSAEHSFTPISRPLVDYSDLHEAKNASELSSPRNSPVLTSSTNVKTKKKKSKSSSSTIRTSKVKKMSSLVQKWQSLKKQDEVLSEEESDEEDKKARDVANIQQWKQEQILSGQAENNPNFVEIKGDWRERVRKAKMRSSALTKDGSPNP